MRAISRSRGLSCVSGGWVDAQDQAAKAVHHDVEHDVLVAMFGRGGAPHQLPDHLSDAARTLILTTFRGLGTQCDETHNGLLR
jgi:hypothetical protein